MMPVRILSLGRSLLAGDLDCQLQAGAVALNRPGRWGNGPDRGQSANSRRYGFRAWFLCVLFVLTACQTAKKPDYQPLVARFYLEVRPGEVGIPAQLPVSGVRLMVNAKPVFVEYDLVNAEVAHVDLGSCLLLQLSPAAARDLYRLSVTSLGRRLVLFLNDVPLGARRIEQALPDGVILVFVETPDTELGPLVARLKRTSEDIAAAAAKK
jgi:hypothetical protein